MSDEIIEERIEVAPVAALTLNYSDQRAEALQRVLRLVVWIFVLWQLQDALVYLIDVACYLWEQSNPLFRRTYLSWGPLLTKTPRAIVAFYLLVSSSSMIRFSAAGRKWILIGAITQAVIAFLMYAFDAVDVVYGRKLFRNGNAYGTEYLLEYVWLAIFNPAFNILIFRIFDSKLARDLAG